MLQVEEARAVLLRHMPSRRVEHLPLDQALGLVLAENLVSPEALPPFPRSGMDGYALRSADTQAATKENPVTLPLAGVIPAGHPLGAPLLPGSCASIMTGGAVPAGADAVIRLEEVRVTPEGVKLFRPVPAGENVAPVGEDVQLGQTVLPGGHTLRAAETGLLTAIGIATVPVVAPPRVGILCTGHELVPPGAPMGPGQIRNSNGPCLAALVRARGCVPVDLGTAVDTPEAIAGRLSQAADCDLILTTGGVSVGDYDFVRAALSTLGARELFWRISVKPGTPVCAALLGDRLVIGLSGNPAAAITNFDILVRPLLDTLCGRAQVGLRETEGVLEQAVLKTAGVARYMRVRAYAGPDGSVQVDTSLPQRASVLSSMMYANAYAVIPAHAGPVPAGTRVRLLLQDDAEVGGLCR
jgi:molybdopterin molybdotransferase